MQVLSSDEHARRRGALLADAALEQISRVGSNDPRLQSLNLSGSPALKAKAESLVSALAEALKVNSSLTLLDLSSCALDDAALTTLSAALEGNAALYHLDLSSNAFTPTGGGLLSLAGALRSNTGLMRLGLEQQDIDDAPAEQLAAALTESNVTLLQLSLSEGAAGAHAGAIEAALTRNRAVDRALRAGSDYEALLPEGAARAPLVVREVLDETLRAYDDSHAMLWCRADGAWALRPLLARRALADGPDVC